MLISHKKKFIFIHIYKTAGTSITDHLIPYCRFIDRVVYDFPVTKKVSEIINRYTGKKDSGFEQILGHHKHATALAVRNNLDSKLFNEYYTFCVIRNPWDWRVSLYNFLKQAKHHSDHEKATKYSFHDFIKYDIDSEPQKLVDFVQDEQGNDIVDFVAKFENLDNDFQGVTTHLDIAHKKLNTLNISRSRNKKNYKEYYNDESADLVFQYFKEDIEKFNYKF